MPINHHVSIVIAVALATVTAGCGDSTTDGAGGAGGGGSTSNASTTNVSTTGGIPEGPVTGTIGGQPFKALSGGIEGGRAIVADFDNVCGSEAGSVKANSAYVYIYLPQNVVMGMPYTVTEDSYDDAHPHVNVKRRDGTCSQTTDDYATVGTVIFTQATATMIAGTVDATTDSADHVSGTFSASCSFDLGNKCVQ